MRRRAVLAVCLLVAGVDGDCDPASYLKVSAGADVAPTSMCGGNSYNGWNGGAAWGASGGCARGTNHDYCGCYCSNSWTSCWSKFSDSYGTCFSDTLPCVTCPGDSYNPTCGCSKANPDDAYSSWSCDAGSCPPCPSGTWGDPTQVATSCHSCTASPAIISTPGSPMTIVDFDNSLISVATALSSAATGADADTAIRSWIYGLAVGGVTMSNMMLSPSDVTYQWLPLSCSAINCDLTDPTAASKCCIYLKSTVGPRSVNVDCNLCLAGTVPAASGSTSCVACAAGSYAPRGSPYCLPCNRMLLPGTYLPVDPPGPQPLCDVATGHIDGTLPCTACTASSVYGNHINNCPPYAGNLYADLGGGVCAPCTPCSAYNKPSAVLPGYSHGLNGVCVTNGVAQCVNRYINVDGSLNQTGNYMPFVWGKQRVPGSYATSTTGADILPMYQACDDGAVNWDGAQERSDMPSYMNLGDPKYGGLCVLPNQGTNDVPCARDCLGAYVNECKPGYYAQLDAVDSAQLVSCIQCPLNSNTPKAGRSTSCTCTAANHATFAEIQASLASYPDILSDAPDTMCIACATDILAKKGDGEYARLPMECPRSPSGYVTPKVCLDANPPQVVGDVDGSCVNCTDGTYATDRGCADCPAGSSCTKGVRTPCPVGTFAGSTSQAKCTASKSSNQCPPAYALVYSTDSSLDNTCEPCRPSCPSGSSAVVYLSNHSNSSNPCTTGGGAGAEPLRFGACWPSQPNTGEEIWVATQANIRLQYQPAPANTNSEPTVLPEPCPDKLLPPYATWVNYAPAAAAYQGKQCYFACNYGVNAQAATALRDAIQLAVNHARVDLVDFMVARDGQGDGADVTQVTMRWLWGSIAYTGAAGLDNTQVDQWGWTYDYAGVPVYHDAVTADSTWYNTFLMVDEVMSNSYQYLAAVQGELPPPAVNASGAMSESWAPYNATHGHASASAWDGLCMPLNAPQVAFACPSGATTPPQDPGNPVACALIARGQNLYLVKNMSGNGDRDIPGYVVAQTDKALPSCISVNTGVPTTVADVYQNFALPCKSCMQQWRDGLTLASGQDDVVIGSADASALSAVDELTRYSLWRSQYGRSYALDNPYNFVSGHCDSFSCGQANGYTTWKFKYTAKDVGNAVLTPWLQACVPCDVTVSQAVCAIDGKTFVPCAASAAPTQNESCITCAAGKPGVSHELVSIGEYDSWLSDFRPSNWAAITCRYACDVGYTSNPILDAYNARPCILCNNSAVPQCRGQGMATAVYIQNYLGTNASGRCGFMDTTSYAYAPYEPQCVACQPLSAATSAIVFTPAGGIDNPYTDNSDCLALCNTSSYLTHLINVDPPGTVLTNIGAGTFYFDYDHPQPQSSIDACIPCAARHDLPCGANHSCGMDTYKTKLASSQTGFCTACSQDPCPLKKYRERCMPGSTADAVCRSCDGAGLMNSPGASSANQKIQKALDDAAGVARQWVACDAAFAAGNNTVLRVPQSMGGWCCAVCVNNMVLINVTSGLRPPATLAPIADAPGLACVSCQSTFVMDGSVDGAKPLYSVWNATADAGSPHAQQPEAYPGSALAGMAGEPGGCVQCDDDDHRNTTADDDELCSLKAGVTDLNEGLPGGTAIAFGQGYNNNSDGSAQTAATRRRLLQAGQGTVYSVNLKFQPLVSATSSNAFHCCGGAVPCQSLALEGSEYNKYLVRVDYCGPGGGGASRRLLQQPPPPPGGVAPCASGQYKPARGDGACYDCPAGASTSYPWNGLTHAGMCGCLPGYRATRDPATGVLLSCAPCGAGRFRPPSVSDDACYACPQGTRTPLGVTASGYCYCDPGTYAVADASTLNGMVCAACPGGYYCDGTPAMYPCPPNSGTSNLTAASSRGDCVCLPGYYGTLSVPGQYCFPAPPAMVCTDGSATAADSGCTCQKGWTKYTVLDATVTPNVARQSCVTSCGVGYYAQIDRANMTTGSCVPCPLNTYSGPGLVLQAIGRGDDQQCSMCPPNFYTTTTGARAISDCVCGGVLGPDGSCGGCPRDYYLVVLDSGAAECAACPEGMHAPPGSVGPLSCSCPPGARSVRDAASGDWICDPCPVGFYSATVGSTCTPCPGGSTTRDVGQSSVHACVCAGTGFPPRPTC